jgi:tetratricopeptide (TPR) repeat protein
LKAAVDKLPAGHPSTGVIHFHLGMTYKELGLKDQATATLKKAIELLPKDSPEVSKGQAALVQLDSGNNAPNSNNTN